MNLQDSPLTIARIAELEEQVERFRAEWEQKDRLIQGNQKRAWADERRIAELEHEIQGLRSNLDLALMQIETKKSEYQELLKENERLENENKRIREQCFDLQKSLVHCVQERKRLEDVIDAEEQEEREAEDEERKRLGMHI